MCIQCELKVIGRSRLGEVVAESLVVRFLGIVYEADVVGHVFFRIPLLGMRLGRLADEQFC